MSVQFESEAKLAEYIDAKSAAYIKGAIEAWEKKAGGPVQLTAPGTDHLVSSDELTNDITRRTDSIAKEINSGYHDPRFTPGLMQSENYRVLVTKWVHGMVDREARNTEWREAIKQLGEYEAVYNPGRSKTIDSGSGSAGAEFMPVGFEREIWHRIGVYNQMRTLARVMPVTGKITFPSSTTRATAYYTAPVTAPAGQSGLASASVTIDPHKLICWDEVDKKLFYASTVDLTDFLASTFAEALAYAELYYFTNGNGTNQPSGFANHTAYSSVTAVSLETGLVLAWNDLINLEYTPDAKYRMFGAYQLSTNALKLVCKLQDADKRPIWTRPVEGKPGLINGYPYVLNETIPGTIALSGLNTTEIYFGDWKAYVIGDMKTLALEMSDQAGDSFKNDTVYVKMVAYNDGKLRDQAAIDYLTGVHH